MGCSHAAHVTFSLIKGPRRGGLAVIVPCDAEVRVGTTASCVAPGSDVLVTNGRAPQPGTAPVVTPEFGSAPRPGHRVEARVGANARSTREACFAGARTGRSGSGRARPPAAGPTRRHRPH